MLSDKELLFWADIFEEHMLFLMQLLSDSVPHLIEEATVLRSEWKNVGHNRRGYDTLLYDTMILKKTIIDRSMEEKINKMISRDDFIDLVNHMLRELYYTQSSLHRELSRDEEISFWMYEGISHTSMLAGLVKENPPIKEDMLYLAGEMGSPITLLSSNEMAEILKKEKDYGTISTPMTNKMIEHEIKETNHGLNKLSKLHIL